MGRPSTAYMIGEASLLIQCAEIYRERGNQLLGVISRNPAITRWADQHGIRCTTPGPDLIHFLEGEFDYLFSVANLRMLPAEVLARAQRMAINFHDGPLPRYAGTYATTWAIANQETEHGVTWHEMTVEADEGRILAQRCFEFTPDETAFSLNTRCYAVGMETFAELVDQLGSGELDPVEQDFSLRSYYGRYQRPEAAGLLPWHRTSAEIIAHTRSLDFGHGYENPLSLPKVLIDGGVYTVGAIEDAVNAGRGAAGTVLRASADTLVVATTDGAVRISGLVTLDGRPSALGSAVGKNLAIAEDARAELSTLAETLAPQEAFWVGRLRRHEELELPHAGTGSDAPRGRAAQVSTIDPTPLEAIAPDSAAGHRLAVAVELFLARLTGSADYQVRLRNAGDSTSHPELFATDVPTRVRADFAARAGDQFQKQCRRLADDLERGTYPRDVFQRYPGLEPLGDPSVFLQLGGEPGDEPTVLTIAIGDDGRTVTWSHDTAKLDADDVARLQDQFARFLAGFAAPDRSLGQLSILSEADGQKLEEWNRTGVDYDRTSTIDRLFRSSAAAHREQAAVRQGSTVLTYGDLDERSDRLASALRARGVVVGDRVGIALNRTPDMVVALLAVLKAGVAYVPLDPEYPADRLDYIAEDSDLKLVLGDGTGPRFAGVESIDVGAALESAPATSSTASHGSQDLAYVIYTSGSTGRPKGVEVEHRNAVNFFVGMDQRIADGDARDSGRKTWLAVTSLSFDISVLELLWTLTRGFEVVLHDAADRHHGDGASKVERRSARELDLSFFYFSSDESQAGNKYRLLMEGAKYADQNGFAAVWTPERHFHAFGGLYPNPAVASAAIAAMTERVQIRAGSIVSPLHSSIRVAEDWSLVDNLSNGRVALAFAAGWQPNDFVLMPQNFEHRKEVMFSQIEEVQTLWQGGSITARDGTGKDIEVRTLPRPVQAKLPVWITIAGNPESFREAGERGYNVLTHLLGQTFEDVQEKIEVYRAARREAGHDGDGHVTIMLHTFCGDDPAAVKETVREPMKRYLRSAVGLVQKAAWSFPTFKDSTIDESGRFTMDNLGPEELDAILDYAFERYYEGSGLFGTLDQCHEIIEKVRDIGCDEVACLIDFGIDPEVVIDHFDHLRRLRERVAGPQQPTTEADAPSTIGELIERHDVSHLQCTPSMASMLVGSPDEAKALARLDQMFVGGEALPQALAEKLVESLGGGRLMNMYGPTETTVWSSTQVVTRDGGVSIGSPIANTEILILDAQHRALPVGVPGELCIGGDGVVRGYHQRPELTQERFVHTDPDGRGTRRFYRTGDLARWRNDGRLEFLGRMDHQVKIRGYRIELGEIESLLAAVNGVKEAVVLAREDSPGDVRLVGYYLSSTGRDVEESSLRESLVRDLPSFMVPANFVRLERWPLTPNKKIDRKQLPAPSSQRTAETTELVQPGEGTAAKIAEIWKHSLRVESIGSNDNFFDLGGHSLLAVQVHGALKEHVDSRLSLVDLFRFPTVKTLAAHVDKLSNQESAAPAAVAVANERGNRRNEMAARRRRR